MPLAGAPRDLYIQLLACSSSQRVVAIACYLRAILCFGFCLLAVSACTTTALKADNVALTGYGSKRTINPPVEYIDAMNRTDSSFTFQPTLYKSYQNKQT